MIKHKVNFIKCVDSNLNQSLAQGEFLDFPKINYSNKQIARLSNGTTIFPNNASLVIDNGQLNIQLLSSKSQKDSTNYQIIVEDVNYTNNAYKIDTTIDLPQNFVEYVGHTAYIGGGAKNSSYAIFWGLSNAYISGSSLWDTTGLYVYGIDSALTTSTLTSLPYAPHNTSTYRFTGSTTLNNYAIIHYPYYYTTFGINNQFVIYNGGTQQILNLDNYYCDTLLNYINGVCFFRIGGAVSDSSYSAGEITNSVMRYDKNLTASWANVLPRAVRSSMSFFGSSHNSSYVFITHQDGMSVYNSSGTRVSAASLTNPNSHEPNGEGTTTHAIFWGGNNNTDSSIYAGSKKVEVYNKSLTKSTWADMSANRYSVAGSGNISRGATANDVFLIAGGTETFTQNYKTIDSYDSNGTHFVNLSTTKGFSTMAPSAVSKYIMFGGGAKYNPNLEQYEISNKIDIYETY